VIPEPKLREVVREVIRELVTTTEDARTGERYTVRTLIVDPTTYIWDVVHEIIIKYCEITGKCQVGATDEPDAIVAVSTSNCKRWADELFETLTILAVIDRTPYTIHYTYDGGIVDLWIDEAYWHHLEIPKNIQALIDEIYGDLVPPCRN